ncbi:MAG: hypothetical protein WB985_03950 [Candidatus Acidiferrales bacterium]
MTVCDGCGRPVDAEHVKARIERLQLATRFRPIHIQTLVIDACPPQTLSDFFYNVGGAGRSAAARAHFGELAHCVGDLSGKALGAETSDEAVLTEWQRRGLFLAFVVDCPFESEPALAAAVAKSASTLQLRLATSYKPKSVALLSKSTELLIPSLLEKGWKDKLILDCGRPFEGADFGSRLNAALLHA